MMNLNAKYNRDQFLSFLKEIFLKDYQSDIRPIPTSEYKSLDKAFSLGRSEFLDLQVFEFEYSGSFNKRIALAKDAFQVMKQSAVFQALAVFHSREKDDWRFSLMTANPQKTDKGKVTLAYSNPRRYSFYLGPDAKTNTPYQFLIKQGTVENLEDLISRFSVEVVSDSFYKEYRGLFIRLTRHLQKDRAFQAFVKQNGIDTVNFAKKMLGQIVFLYFIQRKGWLGAKKGDFISNGDKGFLRTLFNRSLNENLDFFNHYLEPLFYNALNSKPEKAGSFYRNHFDCQIPFLNGGLFEPLDNYSWDKEYLHIPNSLFSNSPKRHEEGQGILDIFDSYNFTIYENDPVDKEVSIDPEMLGQIFEKLGAITTESFDEWAEAVESGNKTKELKANKKLGVYYTPREIVHYMCRESIGTYLVSNLTDVSHNEIETYLDAADALSSDLDELKKTWTGEMFALEKLGGIDSSLKNIRIVDPACGSGAFLIGMLQQIVRLRAFARLSSNMSTIQSYYDLKKETIQNCIYGVDIDPGATEIAKLRLWLSLVVDHELEEIEPLPNLDYKVMQGNSLLENLVIGDGIIKFKFNGSKRIDGRTKEMKNLFEEENQAKLFYDPSETLAEKLEKYHTQFFHTTNRENKKILKKKIDDIENELITSKCDEEIRRFEDITKNSFHDSDKVTKATKQILSIKDILTKWRKDKLRPFFPWKLHFSEVFNEKNGFDVVIANPPYGADIGKNELKILKKNLVDTRNTNSAAMFIDFSKNQLLNKNGSLSFIVPKSLLYSEVWFDLVKSLIGKTKVLVDVEKAFDKVLLEQVVFVYGNSVLTNTYLAKKFLNNKFLHSTQISNTVVDQFGAWICDITEDQLQVAYKVLRSKNLTFMANISTTKRGVGLQKYIKEEGNIPVVGGKNIFRYGLDGYKGFLSGSDLKSNSSKVSFMGQPKIMSQNIVAHIQNPKPHIQIIATYDKTGEIYNLDTVNNTIITDPKFEYEYILALLNSSFVSWYCYKFVFCSAIRTMHFDNSYIGKIPIPKANSQQQKPIIEMVNRIMSLTQSSDYLGNVQKQELCKEYENSVDQYIYDLYEFSPKEIEIVKGGHNVS